MIELQMLDFTDTGRTFKLAQMYPNDIELIDCTRSEKDFYYELKRQLSDSIHVFFSVRWYSQNNGTRENSESDFLIFDPDFGYITIEVKGGQQIEKQNDTWILHLDDSSYRKLKKSPFEQAEESMRFFKKYFEDQYKQVFNGAYGFACAFPRYNVPEGFGTDAPKDIIIDFSDMSNLKNKINSIFHYWSSTRRSHVFLVDEIRKKFINLINKRINMSTISGAVLENQDRKMSILNRIQENYLDFLENYSHALIVGGAGTGKTWLAVKKAIREAEKEKDVLLLCFNNDLGEFLKERLFEYSNITVNTFWQFVKEQLDESDFLTISSDKELLGVFDKIANKSNLKKFNSIIVDEAQDFNEEWAMTIRLFLRDESRSDLYVLYDTEQNIFNRDFKNGFMIESPPFRLKENLRNTSEIMKWVKNTTQLGYYTKANNIPGVRPEVSTHNRKKDARNRLESILKQLVQKELVKQTSITILSNRILENSILSGKNTLGPFTFAESRKDIAEEQVLFRTVQGFKGLESDVVIYLKHNKHQVNPRESNQKTDFVAYTRAKFLLFVIEYLED
jgi:hypothetical protein